MPKRRINSRNTIIRNVQAPGAERGFAHVNQIEKRHQDNGLDRLIGSERPPLRIIQDKAENIIAEVFSNMK